MKKAVSLLLAIVMVLGLVPMNVFAQETERYLISFETDFTNDLGVGDSFTVTASLENNYEPFGSMALSLNWNETAVAFKGFKTNGRVIESDVFNTSLGYTPALPNHTEGVITAVDTAGYDLEGTLFVAQFEIVGNGALGIGLKTESATDYKISNLTGTADIPATLDLSELEGLTVGGKPVGPTYDPEWPFTKITTDKGDVINIVECGTLEFDPFGMGGMGGTATADHYRIKIPEGAKEAYVRFEQPVDYFVSQDFMIGVREIGSNYVSVNHEDLEEDAGSGMAGLQYREGTGSTYTEIVIPLEFAAGDFDGSSVFKLSALKSEEELYYAVGPQDTEKNVVALFSLEYGEAAGGEEESSHTHSYTKTDVADTNNFVSAATCLKPAVYRKACECGIFAPPDSTNENDFFTVGEVADHVFGDDHVCTTDGCNEAEPKYAITAAAGITVTSDAAGKNAITNAYAGDTVYLHAEPQEGKTAVFTVGEEAINGTSFTMPAEEVSVSVNYEDITYYNIIVATDVVGGTVVAKNEEGDEITRAVEGQLITFELVADAGYTANGRVMYKIGDGEYQVLENGILDMPEGDVTVSTVFTANSYSITANYDKSLGSVTVNSSARTGETVSLVIEHNEDVIISAYSGTYGEENTPFPIGSTFTMPAGDVTVNITFKKNNAIKKETFEIKHPSIVTLENGTRTMTMKEGATRTLKSFMETVEEDLAPTQHIEYRSTLPDYVSVDPLTCEIKVLQYTEETVMIQAFVVDDSISWASDEPLREVKLTIEKVSDGYTVSLDKDQEVFKLGEVTIPVTVGTSGENTPNKYHAYELILAYDSRYLELNEKILSGQASVSQVSVDGTMRTVAIRHYGNEKTVSADKINLPFIASEIGEAYVELKSAKVGLSEEALNDDASDAEVITTDIWVEVNGYKVTLGEGFIGPDVADPADDYVFTKNTSRINEALYDYEFEFKVNGKDVEVDGNGTDADPYRISIEKYKIDGEITIRIHKETPKKFEVTKNGDAADCLSFESGVDFDSVNSKFFAQYNREVKVKLTPAEGKVLQDYDAAVITIGGDTKEYLADNGIYTIPGTDITGEIVITVNEKSSAEPSEYNVTFTGRGCRHLAENTPHKAEAGKPYSFTVNHAEGFTYTVAATMNNTAAELTTVETKEAEKVVTTTYTITEVTGDLTINIDMTDRAVEVKNYLDLVNNSTMFLVKATETLFDDEILTYDGSQMYVKAQTNEGKQEWRYLVIVSGQQAQTTGEEGGDSQTTESATLTKDAAAQNMAIRALTEQETVNTWAPTGNVNGSETLDINDAQLVYDMYNKKHSGFNENATMTKFLNADVNANDTIDTQDAQAVVNAIIAANNETRSQNTVN